MSSGAFVNTFYASQSDLPNIYPIRVQPETIAATVTPSTGADVPNTPDAGPANVSTSAQVGGSTRRAGLHAPVIYASLTGSPPTNYASNSRIVIPALNNAFYVAAKKNTTLNYLGTTWRITGRRAEKIR